jgi:RecA-family ATPase
MEPKEAAWQRLDRVTAKRKNLLAAGYRVIPTSGKRPFLDGWENINATDADIDDWARQYADALNTGIITSRTPGVDIDVYDDAVADELQEILWTMIGDNGQAIVRYGQRPKRLTLFQTDEPFTKIATPVFHSPDNDEVAHRVEVLCNGQQFIADGIHPDTGSSYVWEGGEPGAVLRDDLPYLNRDMATEFVARATEVFRRHGWVEKAKSKKDRAKGNGHAASGQTNFDALYGDREQKWAATALANLVGDLANTFKGDRNERLYSAACRMGTMTVRNWIGRDTVIANLVAACRANGYTNDPDHGDPADTINRGLDWGEGNPHEELSDKQTNGDAGSNEGVAPPAPLQWLNMSRWDCEPAPLREWAIPDRVPLKQAGLFSGEGGTGKSIIELQKNVAHVTGKDWFGSLPLYGPAFYVGAEDEADELHRRLAAIAQHYGVTFKELIEGGLHVLCLLGQDATLCAATGKSGKMEVTSLYRQLYEAAGDIKPRNISIDTLSRAFAGNEIDRVQVYGFANHMQALAMVAGGSVTVLSHPSLAGIASGSGISGSTAWHGAVRFRQYLKGSKAADGEQPDNDLRELEFKKNQYGPTAETIVLRYQNGLFLPEAGISNLDKLAREAKVDEIFLRGLGQIIQQGRDAIAGENSPEFGPTLIATLPEAKKERVRKKDLTDAMNRLLAANKIHVGRTAGPPSKAKKCLLPGGGGGEE